MPSCGARNLFRLGAPINFDRYAFFYSLLLPQAALLKKARHQLEYYSELLYVLFDIKKMAERMGFEPMWDCSQTVFKTASL